MKFSEMLKVKLEASKKMPIFEIPVYNIVDKEDTYLLCHIKINSEAQTIEATREPINKIEAASDKIACNSMPLDEWHDLDAHLEALYFDIIYDIQNNSDFFMLTEDY